MQDTKAETVTRMRTNARRRVPPARFETGGTTVARLRVVPGKVGRFRLLAPLGMGAMGIVFRARDEVRKIEVALKLIPSGPLVSAAGQTARFRREAQSLAKLDHPNIVPLLETGEADGCLYIALELIEGGSLSPLHHATLSLREKLSIARDIARALSHAHGQGLVHRDVKPSNILLREDGTAVLTDFGLAGDHAEGTRITHSVTVLGTPAYMSPEQAEGIVSKVDLRTDIWSLGVVLYELLAGRLPFDALDVEGLIEQVRREEPPSLRSISPETPPDVAAVVSRAMSRNPEGRYPTAAALAEDLDLLIQGKKPEGTRVSIWRRAWTAIRRRWNRLAA